MTARLAAAALLVALALGASGCAGTLHYPTYAEAQRDAYQARMRSRAQIVDSLTRSMSSGSEGARVAAAMAIAMMLSRDPSLRMEAPRDRITDALGIIAPIAGMWGIADTVGRHMAGHGGTTVTAGDRSTIGIGSGGDISGATETLTVSGDQAQGGMAGGDQTLTSSPQRDTGNTTSP